PGAARRVRWWTEMKQGAWAIAGVLWWICVAPSLHAQERGGRGGPPATAKARAPIDLTGYWTAVITEDWHTRMLTAPKGDFGSGPPGAIEVAFGRSEHARV